MQDILEIHRRSARLLKKAFKSGVPDAAQRVRTVVPEPKVPTHADFLHVIAVEAGHESWPKFKLAVETATMSREERVARLRRALFLGQAWVIEKLLTDDPGLKNHDLGLELAFFDRDAVTERVSTDPAAALTEIDGRSPLLHLCNSRYHKCIDVPPEQIVALADLLHAHGADPNDSYPDPDGSGHRLSALYGALGHADNMPLAEWLLAHGANPDDDESLYHSVELEHMEGLRLLCRYGVNPSETNALPRALDFDRIDAVRLLLEHGADPNEGLAQHPSGEPAITFTALHQAARRGRAGAFADLLLAFGADPSAKWKGLTAYDLACLYGNNEFARTLADHGHGNSLAPDIARLAACAGGSAPSGRIRERNLPEEARLIAVRLAGTPGCLPHLRALIEAGLDPEVSDEMGVTALHAAAWSGQADQVAYFLSLDPDLSHRNKYGGDAMGTVLHGAEFSPRSLTADHIQCARLLLDAGAAFPERGIAWTGSEEMADFLADWRDRHMSETS